MTQMTIGQQRLANQRLSGDQCPTPEAAVAWMGAVQAQDYKQALWAVGSRMTGATLAAVEAAVTAGHILRTWPMRGTIHFVLPREAKWLLTLCAQKVLAGHGRRMAQLGLDETTMVRCGDLCREVLADGQPMTRAALLTHFNEDGISTERQRGYHILWHLAHKGLICLGPQQGRHQTFALLDRWAPDADAWPREQALAALVTRYFVSHGPATTADFARWSGLTLGDIRQGIALAGDALRNATIDGTEYWLGAAVAVNNDEPRALLLAGFDEFVIGYKDRDAVLPPEHAAKVVPGNNGVFQPLIVHDGRVIGTWQRKLKAKSLDITLKPFVPLGADRLAQVTDAAAAYSAFMGLRLAKTDLVPPA